MWIYWDLDRVYNSIQIGLLTFLHGFNYRNVPKITWLNIFFKWLGMNIKHGEKRMFDELIKMYQYHLHV